MEGNSSSFYTRNEIETVKKIMENSIRHDNRDILEPRQLNIEFSDYSSIIKLGNTIVTCTTKINEIKPREEKPSEGFFKISLNSTFKLDSNFKSEVLNPIRDVIINTNALDLESLVIIIGKSVWELNCEVVIQENDGGLFEAITISVLCSLLSVKIPSSRGYRPLVLHHLPLAITFIYLNQNLFFLDPTFIESQICQNYITIFGNCKNEICSIIKNGGIPLLKHSMGYLISISLDIIKNWHLVIIKKMGKNAPNILLFDINTQIIYEKINNNQNIIENKLNKEEEEHKEEEDKINENLIDLNLISLYNLH